MYTYITYTLGHIIHCNDSYTIGTNNIYECGPLYILYMHVQLLQNLEYSEAVQVHIVNNGQEMMGFDRWDVSKFLQ